MDSTRQPPELLAIRLAVANKRLRARLREVAGGFKAGFSLTQLAILKHLRHDGPATASQLATVEHISPQAVAQSLTTLKQAGLIDTSPYPNDRRKTRIALSAKGDVWYSEKLDERHAWLARAIEATVPPEEWAAFEKAVERLEQLPEA